MSGERTEAPTPKRLREARRRGQVARSPEVVAWAQVLAATVLVPLSASLGSGALAGFLAQLEGALTRPDPGAALRLVSAGAWAGVVTFAPLALGLAVVGMAGSLVQTGAVWSPGALRPRPERINPLKGLRRIFSPASVWEAGKALIKVSVLAAVALPPLQDLATSLAGVSRPPAAEVLPEVAGRALAMMRNTALAGLVLAGADFAFQRRRVRKSVKMTRRDVRDEHRQSEGDPFVKSQIRRRQLEVSRNRMMAEVGRATVVVVNPTHVAVALRYTPGSGAPRVVAKGKGPVAARIRAEAERHRVPVVHDRPLARSLHAACRLGQEIPADLYEAVARVLAFVFSLRRTPI